jgi:DNA-binding NarL/FixJ family response regulator
VELNKSDMNLMECVASGWKPKDIALELGIEETSIRTSLTRLKRLFGFQKLEQFYRFAGGSFSIEGVYLFKYPDYMPEKN